MDVEIFIIVDGDSREQSTSGVRAEGKRPRVRGGDLPQTRWWSFDRFERFLHKDMISKNLFPYAS